MIHDLGEGIVFDLDVNDLFALVGMDGLLKLQFDIVDPDGFSGSGVFANESVGQYFNRILPGIQGRTPAQLDFTVAAVPLPAGLPLLLAWLGTLAFAKQRRRQSIPTRAVMQLTRGPAITPCLILGRDMNQSRRADR